MDGYGRTRMHDNMVPWALRALGTKTDKAMNIKSTVRVAAQDTLQLIRIAHLFIGVIYYNNVLLTGFPVYN